MYKRSLILLSITLGLSACNDASTRKPATLVNQEETNAPTTADGEILLNAGDNMKFEKETITVKAGDTVKLRLVHTGKIAKAAMGHNFVLLKKGTNIDQFITNRAGKEDYIPNNGADIIAHTRLLGGGESDLIQFLAPEKGTYTFLCSFPGHAAMMVGKFIVE
jgi:azurin